jgi:hypothetical protein
MPTRQVFIVSRFSRTIRKKSKPADDIEAWRAQQPYITRTAGSHYGSLARRNNLR